MKFQIHLTVLSCKEKYIIKKDNLVISPMKIMYFRKVSSIIFKHHENDSIINGFCYEDKSLKE